MVPSWSGRGKAGIRRPASVGEVGQDEVAVVVAFNDAINAADLDALVALMTQDHRFVDSAGGTVEGRVACREAWSGFFESFPGYRNVFDTIVETAPGQVTADGRSECTFEPLDGPARWHAVVADGLLAEWRVEEP